MDSKGEGVIELRYYSLSANDYICFYEAALLKSLKACGIRNLSSEIAKDFLSVKVPFRSFVTLDDALNWVREMLRDVGANNALKGNE